MRIDPLYRAVETWGKIMQFIIVMEECAELIKVLSKNLRGEDNRLDVLDEIADVSIMLEQVKIILGISEKELGDRIEEKIKRIELRLDKVV